MNTIPEDVYCPHESSLHELFLCRYVAKDTNVAFNSNDCKESKFECYVEETDYLHWRDLEDLRRKVDTLVRYGHHQYQVKHEGPVVLCKLFMLDYEVPHYHN